jgi:hypothetical protein
MMVGESKSAWCDQIRAHYEANWGRSECVRRWEKGPTNDLPDDFRILSFSPAARAFWTYATCCMSRPHDDVRVELHFFSPIESDGHIELLTVIGHYHRTGARLNVGHVVNLGRPWLPGSGCDHGLISLPYLDGPALENLVLANGSVRCLWLIPITQSEAEFATRHGLEALEERFEEARFNYLDPSRSSVV